MTSSRELLSGKPKQETDAEWEDEVEDDDDEKKKAAIPLTEEELKSIEGAVDNEDTPSFEEKYSEAGAGAEAYAEPYQKYLNALKHVEQQIRKEHTAIKREPGEAPLPGLPPPPPPTDLLSLSQIKLELPDAKPLVVPATLSRESQLKHLAPSPWGRIPYFLTILIQALGLSVDRCFASFRFKAFLEAYARARSRNKASFPEPEVYLQDHCELLVSRITRFINWPIEKALVSIRFASGRRPLGLYEIICDAECMTHFITLCTLIQLDVAVHSGRKYMPRNASKLDVISKCEEMGFFRHLRRPLAKDTPGELAFVLNFEQLNKLEALQKFTAEVEAGGQSPNISLDLMKSFQIEQAAKRPRTSSSAPPLPFHYDFILYLLGIVPEAELDQGLPKTAYFIRLLLQATAKNGTGSTEPESKQDANAPPPLPREDLDFEITDIFPAYHISSIIERTGDLKLSILKVCMLLKHLCYTTLHNKSHNEILEWMCRDRVRLVKGTQMIVYSYSIFVKILERRSAGINALTSRDMHRSMLGIASWFHGLYA